mmetsp:Transcript_68056/g.221603  ORF Transcript_68056/g.221603 Transcript_68056/m.221603 type:complete len:310 (-) Transcript_68056:58-987(-)
MVSARTRVVYEDIPLSSLVGANLEVDVQGLDPFEQSARLEGRRRSSFLGSSLGMGMRVRSSIAVSLARSRLAGLGSSMSRSSSGPKAPSKTPVAIKQGSIEVSGFNKDLVYAEELPASVPADAVWRVKSHGKTSGNKYDNVLRISVIDALDDPEVGAIIVQVHSLDADDSTPIPEREEGHELVSLDACMAFKPLRDEEGSYTGRCQVDRFVTLNNIPSALARTISWMPSWVLRGTLTSALAKEVQDVGDFARFSKVLEKMMENSTRASLYSSLSCRSGEDEKVRASLMTNLGSSFASDRSGSVEWSVAV